MQADSAPKGLYGLENVTSFVFNIRGGDFTFEEKAGFRRLSTGMAKRLQLDPSATKEDLTMTMYCERTHALMPEDREQIHVHIPFGEEIERIQHRMQVFYTYTNINIQRR